MYKPAQFMSEELRGRSPADLVALVNKKQQLFDSSIPPRGFATTACILMTNNDGNILAFNEIPFVCTTEYASTPRGVERAPKFAALGHAEVGALAFAARMGCQTLGGTMVLAWFPCINCADAIVKAGIRKLIATRPDDSYKPATYDFPAAMAHLLAHGVEVVLGG